jgi:hypothetical protein
MPFANPVCISLATSQAYVSHGPYVQSPLVWQVSTITSSKPLRRGRWSFDITLDTGGQNHVGWLRLGPALLANQLDANLALLAEIRETITLSIAFNATSCEDLLVQLQP